MDDYYRYDINEITSSCSAGISTLFDLTQKDEKGIEIYKNYPDLLKININNNDK